MPSVDKVSLPSWQEEPTEVSTTEHISSCSSPLTPIAFESPTSVPSFSSLTTRTEGQEVVDAEFVCSFDSKEGVWVCRPYKREILEQQLWENVPGSTRRVAIIATLQKLGVQVFVVNASKSTSTREILQNTRRVVEFVARENTVKPNGYLRCILYQDRQGRLFNLTFSEHSVGPVGKWQEYLDSFSCTQAVAALMILCRSFPCAAGDLIAKLKPAYLSIIFGLVLTEEISLSGLNAFMLVRAAPSVSNFYFFSPFGADSLRKLIIFTLAAASVATDNTQVVLTLFGISAACMALLANVGSRAWHFLQWKPLRYSGFGSSLLAYCFAVLTGIVFPFVGQRTVTVGGKGALESVIQCAVIVGVLFVVSDIDQIQQFLVVGSERCEQELVNLIGAVWWFIALVCSLVVVRKIPYCDQKPLDGERLLVEDHTSPVGYKVPNLPDFEIDPSLAKQGNACCSLQIEFVMGLALAAAMGAGMIFLATTGWQDNAGKHIQDYVARFF